MFFVLLIMEKIVIHFIVLIFRNIITVATEKKRWFYQSVCATVEFSISFFIDKFDTVKTLMDFFIWISICNYRSVTRYIFNNKANCSHYNYKQLGSSYTNKRHPKKVKYFVSGEKNENNPKHYFFVCRFFRFLVKNDKKRHKTT